MYKLFEIVNVYSMFTINIIMAKLIFIQHFKQSIFINNINSINL